MRIPQVVVETAHPARLAKETKSMKYGFRKGSPQPCRCTLPVLHRTGHNAAKDSGDI